MRFWPCVIAAVLIVAGCGDAGTTPRPTDGGNDASIDDAGSDASNPLSHNLVFITSSKVQPGLLGSLEGADSYCNERAKAAKLGGTYKAWLSSSSVDAKDRLGNARGWVRIDGKPVADRVSDLTSGVLWYPISVDELGFSYSGSVLARALTATLDQGTRYAQNSFCGDWTDIGSNQTALVGNATFATYGWTSNSSVGCNEAVQLYCFGVDKTTALTPTKLSGPIAFLSTNWSTNGGIAGADARCQNDATSAGLSGTFKALIATTSASAASRFNQTGDVWVMVDGLPIATSRAAMFADNFERPITVQANGAYINGSTWNGAFKPNVVGAADQTCENWSSVLPSSHGVSSTGSAIGDKTFGAGNTQCDWPYFRLICLQTP